MTERGLGRLNEGKKTGKGRWRKGGIRVSRVRQITNINEKDAKVSRRY